MLLVSSKICSDGIVEKDQLIVENLHLKNITVTRLLHVAQNPINNGTLYKQMSYTQNLIVTQ